MMWCPHKISFSLQDPDAAQTESQPGTMVSITGRWHNSSCANRCVSQNSHTIWQLYATHLKRQIELADVQIRYKKRKMQDMYLKTEIKRGTLRKLDLEIKKLEREVSYAFNGEPFNAHCMLTVTINALTIVLLSSPSSKETSESNNKVINSNKRSKNIVLSSLFHECTVGLP